MYKKIISILLVVLLFVLSGCTKNKMKAELIKPENTKIVTGTETDNKYITCGLSAEKISEDGYLQLYFDRISYSVFVKDVMHNAVWRSLPVKYFDSASVIEVKYATEKGTYVLNSQSDCVLKNNVRSEKIKDGIKVIYLFCPDNDTKIEVYINYTLSDGALNTEASYKIISGTGVLQSISLLPYMAASGNCEKGDYVLLPDGCGMKINTDDCTQKTEKLSFAVYGNDITVNNKKYQYSAIAGVFGIKNSNKAMAATVTKGDAISVINFIKAESSNELNRVYPEFIITPTENKNGRIYYGNSPYSGSIKTVYRFLSGKTADYSGMANACREVLIREKILPLHNISQSEKVNLNLSVAGSIFNKKIIKATTFEQAEEMLIRLKAKGVDNISAVLNGTLSGGVNQDKIENAKALSCLGGKPDFKKLCEYANSQKMDLYQGMDILSANSGSAKNIFNKKAVTEITDSFSTYNKKFINTSKLSGIIEKIIDKFSDTTGYYISDSDLIYTDFSAKTDRQMCADNFSKNISSLLAHKKITVKTGNFYLLKNADKILDIPTETQLPENDFCERVPFMQIILHGCVKYASTPINLSANTNKAILKCIEYGCEPNFLLCYGNEKYEFDKKILFENEINNAVKAYTDISEALGGLSGDRITSYKIVSKGLTCTCFSSGTEIYVNSTDKDAEINGIQVPAMSFLRKN